MKHETTSESTPIPPIAHPSINNSVDAATLELLAKWRLEDATDNPEEVRAAEQELTEFKIAMNETRILAAEPLLYP